MSRPALSCDTWDLFCRVVDNYGDIGIAWRLARQLAQGEGRRVRLVVDRLDVFARIEARIDPALARQILDGITVVDWRSIEGRPLDVAAVVVELLGCGLPRTYLDAMVRTVHGSAAVWIAVEHLSAESWVAGFHGLPSPHPSLPLTKHFFFPGFGDDTGGLLIEPDLDRRWRAFQEAPAAVAASWRRLGVPPPVPGESRIAVFAYPDAPLPALLETLAAEGNWSVLVPGTHGRASTGSRRVHAIPFVGQDDFDRLLWACDAVFVRGEDSFVRAQVAGKPFVWQIYKQPDAVHLTKLRAFQSLYEVGLPAAAAAAQQRLWTAWNDRPDDLPGAARDWLAALPALRHHAHAWRQRLVDATPLIARLVAFVDERRSRPPAPASGLLD